MFLYRRFYLHVELAGYREGAYLNLQESARFPEWLCHFTQPQSYMQVPGAPRPFNTYSPRAGCLVGYLAIMMLGV